MTEQKLEYMSVFEKMVILNEILANKELLVYNRSSLDRNAREKKWMEIAAKVSSYGARRDFQKIRNYFQILKAQTKRKYRLFDPTTVDEGIFVENLSAPQKILRQICPEIFPKFADSGAFSDREEKKATPAEKPKKRLCELLGPTLKASDSQNDFEESRDEVSADVPIKLENSQHMEDSYGIERDATTSVDHMENPPQYQDPEELDDIMHSLSLEVAEKNDEPSTSRDIRSDHKFDQFCEEKMHIIGNFEDRFDKSSGSSTIISNSREKFVASTVPNNDNVIEQDKNLDIIPEDDNEINDNTKTSHDVIELSVRIDVEYRSANEKSKKTHYLGVNASFDKKFDTQFELIHSSSGKFRVVCENEKQLETSRSRMRKNYHVNDEAIGENSEEFGKENESTIGNGETGNRRDPEQNSMSLKKEANAESMETETIAEFSKARTIETTKSHVCESQTSSATNSAADSFAEFPAFRMTGKRKKNPPITAKRQKK